MRCVFSESNYGVVLGRAVNQVHSPPSLVNKVRYHHDGLPAIKIFRCSTIRLMPVAHSSLLINASQRVIFDLTSTLKHDILVE